MEYHRINKESQKDFHFRLINEEHKLNVRFSGCENVWSSPFYLDRVGRNFIRLSSVNTQDNQIVIINTIIRRATFVVLLTKSTGPPQYLIENRLDIPIVIYQKVCTLQAISKNTSNYSLRK